MKTPVIIPAYNEERAIGTVLSALPAHLVEPIVVVNGSTDHTAEIARTFGAHVLDIPEQGKHVALQRGLEYLHEEALDPLFILDADSYPKNPVKWHTRMLTALEPDGNRPVVVSGRAWFTPRSSNRLSPVLRSLLRIGEAIVGSTEQAARTGLHGGQYGPNQGTHIHTKAGLDAVLEQPNYWPQQDRALTHAIVSEPDGVFKQLLHPDTIVFTPESVSYRSITDSIRLGSRRLKEETLRSYTERGIPNSLPFEE